MKPIETCRKELLKLAAENPQSVLIFQMLRSFDDATRKAGAKS